MGEDRAAFARVVREHGPAVHAYIARRSGRQLADDLSAEVWLRAWRSRHTYQATWPGPRPWLYGIARNTLRAHWRLRADRPCPPLELTADPWPTINDRLDAERLRPALEAALKTLGDDNREILLLVAWEQLTPGEIAISLGLPPSTVRSRLHRARSQLQNRLDAQLATETTTYCPEARL